MASWSAQDVFLFPHKFPFSLLSISSTVIPSTNFDIAFKFPLQPFVHATFVTLSPSKSNEISVQHTPIV